MVGKEGEVACRDSPIFVVKNESLSENIEVPEEAEREKNRETKWLEKSKRKGGFPQTKRRSPDSLRGSACLWTAGPQVLLPGRSRE